MIGIYPGSFDPVTLGHLDIIKRAASLADWLIVSVAKNSSKSPIFNIEERVDMLRHLCKDIPNIEIISFDGLLIDFAKKQKANAIIRGLRAITDFEYEMQMAQTNKMLDSYIETIFIATSTQYSYLSSSIVKELAAYGGDISAMVSECVADALRKKFRGATDGTDNGSTR